MLFERKKKKEEQPVFQSDKENGTNTVNVNPGETVTVSISNPNAEANQKAQLKKNNAMLLKIVCSVLAVAAIAYAAYSIVSFISSQVNQSSEKESYLTLSGKNYAESKTVYDAFGKADASVSFKNSIKDYAFVGTNLFLSTHKITPESLYGENADTSALVKDGYQGYALYNLTTNVSYSASLSTEYKDAIFSIDLSKCEKGDYLIYPYGDTTNAKENIYPVSIHSKEAIRETIYTLPDSQKQRKRIVLKNNSASPYTLITVTENGDKLPDGYYDAVLLTQQFVENESGLVDKGSASQEEFSSLEGAVTTINSEYRYKVIAAASIGEASSINAGVSIALSSSLDGQYTSIYSKKNGYSTKTLDSSSSLAGYDYYPEIRELTGYLDNAGNGYSGVIGNDLLSINSSVLGKEAYLVKTGSSITETVKEILEA